MKRRTRSTSKKRASTASPMQRAGQDYVSSRRAITRNWLRSAEMPSPAPRGHYLREFGQSDRETIENANYDASVPAGARPDEQPAPSRRSWRSTPSSCSRSTRRPIPDDKVDAIYMTLLSRKPTPAEKEKLDQGPGKGPHRIRRPHLRPHQHPAVHLHSVSIPKSIFNLTSPTMSLELQANLLRGDELSRRHFVARAASSMLGVGLAPHFMTGKAGAALSMARSRASRPRRPRT